MGNPNIERSERLRETIGAEKLIFREAQRERHMKQQELAEASRQAVKESFDLLKRVGKLLERQA